MPGIALILAIIFISAIPAAAALLWFRLARYPFSLAKFAISLLAGATSIFIALLLQELLARAGILPPLTGRAGLFAEIFIRIAFTEELSRIFLLAPALFAFRRFALRRPSAEGLGGPPGSPAPSALPEGFRPDADTMGKVWGLVAGLGFGILESAIYGASYPMNALLRAFTATPLHAACGSRVGSSIMIFREKPALAVFQFLSAVAIHGIYNLLIFTPGALAPWVAIFVAFSALASSIQAIVRGMRADSGE